MAIRLSNICYISMKLIRRAKEIMQKKNYYLSFFKYTCFISQIIKILIEYQYIITMEIRSYICVSVIVIEVHKFRIFETETFDIHSIIHNGSNGFPFYILHNVMQNIVILF